MDVASLLGLVNNSKLSWGLASIMINLGSRFLIGSMTPLQQTVFSHPVFKRVVLFCIVFMATRDVLLSCALATALILLLECLLHEESPYCVVPGCNVSAAINVATTGPMRMISAAPVISARHDAAFGGTPQPTQLTSTTQHTQPTPTTQHTQPTPTTQHTQSTGGASDLVSFEGW